MDADSYLDMHVKINDKISMNQDSYWPKCVMLCCLEYSSVDPNTVYVKTSIKLILG